MDSNFPNPIHFSKPSHFTGFQVISGQFTGPKACFFGKSFGFQPKIQPIPEENGINWPNSLTFGIKIKHFRRKRPEKEGILAHFWEKWNILIGEKWQKIEIFKHFRKKWNILILQENSRRFIIPLNSWTFAGGWRLVKIPFSLAVIGVSLFYRAVTFRKENWIPWARVLFTFPNLYMGVNLSLIARVYNPFQLLQVRGGKRRLRSLFLTFKAITFVAAVSSIIWALTVECWANNSIL